MVLQEIAKLGRSIIIESPYYGTFLSTLNKVVNTKIERAGVYRRDIGVELAVNPIFWKGLDNEEYKKGILLHELLHVCFNHPTMIYSYDFPELFNIAADLSINQLVLDQDGFDLPDWTLKLEKYGFVKPEDKYQSTKYYYDRLLQNSNEPEIQKLVIAMKAGESTPCSHEGWKDFEKLSDSVRRAIEHQIENQMRTAYHSVDKDCGDLPSHLRGILEGLDIVKKPIFGWQQMIRRFGSSLSEEIYVQKTRRKDNIRFPDMPASRIKYKKHLFCAIDTSGSYEDGEIVESLGELRYIKRLGCGVTICECDVVIGDIYPFKSVDQFKGRTFTGGGGTRFDAPIKYFNDHAHKYSAIIYFTDGEAPCPLVKPKKQILWVLSKGGKSIAELRKKNFPGHIIKIP